MTEDKTAQDALLEAVQPQAKAEPKGKPVIDITNSPPLKSQPTRAEIDKAGLAKFQKLLDSASASEKRKIRAQLGLGPDIRKTKKRKGDNASARAYVRQFGEAVHKEGFQAAPSEAITNKGPGAVELFYEKFEQGEDPKIAEIEELAAQARM